VSLVQPVRSSVGAGCSGVGATVTGLDIRSEEGLRMETPTVTEGGVRVSAGDSRVGAGDSRVGAGDSTVLRAQDVTVDLGARLVYVGGVPITIPRKEMDLLAMLVAAAGRVVSREALIAAAWGRRGAPAKSLEVHIRRLRRRIEADDHHPTHIRTVRGIGYIFDTAPLPGVGAGADRRPDHAHAAPPEPAEPVERAGPPEPAFRAPAPAAF
jgi:DNA-binding winged helix-turn-helix (wHTH) protein